MSDWTEWKPGDEKPAPGTAEWQFRVAMLEEWEPCAAEPLKGCEKLRYRYRLRPIENRQADKPTVADLVAIYKQNEREITESKRLRNQARRDAMGELAEQKPLPCPQCGEPRQCSHCAKCGFLHGVFPSSAACYDVDRWSKLMAEAREEWYGLWSSEYDLAQVEMKWKQAAEECIRLREKLMDPMKKNEQLKGQLAEMTHERDDAIEEVRRWKDRYGTLQSLYVGYYRELIKAHKGIRRLTKGKANARRFREAVEEHLADVKQTEDLKNVFNHLTDEDRKHNIAVLALRRLVK